MLPALAWGAALSGYAAMEVSVLGQPVAPEELERQLERLRDAWRDTQVVLFVGQTGFRTTRGELGVSLEIPEMARRVRGYGRSGNPLADLRDLHRSLIGQTELPWPPVVDRKQLARAIDIIRRKVETPPAVGTRDASGDLVAGRDGLTLDLVEHVAALEASLRAGDVRIRLAPRVVPAPEPLAIGAADGVYLDEAPPREQTRGALPAQLLTAQRAARPSLWLPDQGRECITEGRFSGFCEGPRRVPAPQGEAAHRAEALGLGGPPAVAKVIGGRVPKAWRQAASPIMHAELLWPVPQGRLWRGFGIVTHKSGRKRLHKGLDIGAPAGTPIRAIRAGLVVYSDNGVRGYGNLLVVSHGDGTAALYAHCQAIYVFPGQRVRRGSIVGEVGDTGFARGKHLHFEFYDQGQPVDSMPHFHNRR